MQLEVLEREFCAAPFPIFALPEAVTSLWKPHLGRNLSAMALDFAGTNLRWVIDKASWKGCADALAGRLESDPSFFLEIERNVRGRGNALWEYVAPWRQTDFSAFSNPELFGLYSSFLQRLRGTFEYGVLLVIADFDPPTLTNRLKEIAERRFGEDANAAFTTLTTNVEERTFQKQEELDFMRILTLPKEGRREAVAKHAGKYGFLSYGYKGPLLWTEKYFAEMVAEASSQNLDAAKKLEEHEKGVKVAKERIRRLEKALSQKEREWFAIGRKLVFLKPWRKDMQVRCYPIVEKLLREIARRIGVPLEAARYLLEGEMRLALFDGKVDFPLLLERKRWCFLLAQGGRSVVYSGKEAEKWAASVKEEKAPGVSELHGTPATVGKVTGKACIVNAPEDIAKMREGFVLLSVATNPFLLPAIKKAAAIVTDQGGLTCHAAIVSREFSIPCIVGTRHATRVFKDGDLLAVDADNGVVRKMAVGG